MVPLFDSEPNELIATNDMAIVDATWIAGPASVQHYFEGGVPRLTERQGWFWERMWDVNAPGWMIVSCLLARVEDAGLWGWSLGDDC